jgi:hypothetical protein
VGIEPHRKGSLVATWTWDEGRVTIASIDGVTDEFVLRDTKPRDAPAIAAGAQAQRRYTSNDNRPPAWAPWADNYGAAPSSAREQRRAPRPAQKPKTLFDLLFKF